MKVFITRKIPDVGIGMLRDKGYEVDMNPNDRPLSHEELVSALRAKPYDAVLSLLTDRIDASVMDAAPQAKIFANYAIGFDNFDIAEAKKRNVCLSNTPGGGADRVAEHTWGLILAMTCRIAEGDRFVRAGRYVGWDPRLLPGIRIAEKTLGLVGTGRIGAEVAHIGVRGFGMKVVYFDIVRNEKLESDYGAVHCGSVEEVLGQADIVSLHTPLNEKTRHLMNAERLSMMKAGSFLVNTSRGAVIDEAALVAALKAGKLAGAGLDVYENEPALAAGLAELPNVVLTPHIASASLDARNDMARIAASNIIAVLEGGKALNPV